MARPGGFTNQYPPSSDGFIPNGQPPQFNGRPPVYPEKAPRPMMMGQHLPNITNGNQQFSHPSSLSSQSSRDPSPVPMPTQLTALHRLTPNATPPQMSPVPPHQQTYNNLGSVPTPNQPNVAQDFAASHQSGPNSSAFEHTNSNPHQPGIYRPSNTGNFPSSIRPQQMMPPNDPSRQTSQPSYSNQTPSIPSTTNSASSYSATSSPQRFASQYDQNRQPNAGIFPQGSQAQTNTPNYQGSNFRGSTGILGSSSPGLLAPTSGTVGPPLASAQVKSTGVQSLAGPPIPRTNALGTLPRTEGVAAQPETLDRMAAYGHQPSPNRQQINGPSSYGPPQLSAISQQAQAPESQPSPRGFGQQTQSDGLGPPPAGLTRPGLQNSQLGTNQTGVGLQRIPPLGSGMFQSGSGISGMPPTGPGLSQSGMPPRPGMPPMLASGLGSNQIGPGMPSTGTGLGQSGMPPRPGMPPSGLGSNQNGPGMPPAGPGLGQSGMPPRPGMPPSGLGSNQNGPGMPPAGPGLGQIGMPPRPGMPPNGPAMPSSGLGSNQNGPGMPQNGPGLPGSSTGFNQSRMPPGMPPSGPGMYQNGPGIPPSGPGMPPSGPGMPPNGPGMPPTGPGMAPPTSRGPPTGPSHLPGTNGYPQSSVPSSQLANATYPQQQQRPFQPPPTALGSQLLNDQFNQPQQMHQHRRGPAGSEAGINAQLAGLSVAQQGFSKLWGADSYDLLQCRNILPPEKVEAPRVKLQQEFLDAVNCSPDIFRCTMTKIPETNSLLQKSRLPLGILIHPFKDLNHLAVIQCQSIVRCRACRTYINPFVYFVDHKRWKCNLCFRVNELPEEFQFDPVSKTYGDPSRRPEIKSSTIEFIAPSEYMLRPPQPAVYLFVLDVSCLAVESGYLKLFCNILLDELDKLPGDGRTQIGFITFDSSVHFYSLAEGLNQPQQMVVVDVDDVFLPCPDSLVSNLNEVKELARDLLRDLPKRFAESHDSHSALGAALQAAYKLMSGTGGRVTVFQSCLPNHGPGALVSREVPSARASKDVQHLNPATDFYKRLALDCSGQQIAVDLFIVNQQYCDLATLSGISQFSGGSIHHFPLFKANDWKKADALEQAFRRYLTRKLGLEAVMRIRCSRGLAIHTFHGNFFVRSTDLLSLPNVNPDAGFGMQVSVEESLADLQNVCFQAALLYTSSKGERRIRVHTLCLPVVANLSDILLSADQQCIVGLLSKMAVDRSHLSSLADAREAFINVAVDVVSAYKVAQGHSGSGPLLVPHSLRLLPMYILALLKYIAFRTGASTRLDDRVFAMCQMKTLPLANLIQGIYPDMYPVHRINEQPTIDVDGTTVPQPPRLQLTAEKLESSGAFLLDSNDEMILFIGRNISPAFCQATFGVGSFQEIREDLRELPEVDTEESEALRGFVNYLQTEKSSTATLQIIRDDSQDRVKFYERLVEDRSEASLSYYEFLQHIKSNVK